MTNQTRLDSLIEAVLNTAIGFTISLVVQLLLMEMMRLPVSIGQSVFITAVFTVLSIARSYTLRRLLDGRPLWDTLKSKINKK